MNYRSLFLLGVIISLFSSQSLKAQGPPLKYPSTKKIEQVDNYHGTKVEDPYRWLENDVRNSAEVKDWVEAENLVTNAYLAEIPERVKIRKRLAELWDYENSPHRLFVKAGISSPAMMACKTKRFF